MSWIERAKPWLLVWRLALYAVIAGMWFHRVRAHFRKALTGWQVCRLELMALALFISVELSVYHNLLPGEGL
ncbi:hypothetical protein D5X65_24305 [Salmonella enterica subsp. enterica serovar Suberu]|nr:hypothetical protein [Salmonella enterica subsp. enterica serovar Suberu]